MSDSEDDNPQLSAHTLAALQEFYKEQKEQEDKIQTAQETGDVKNIALGEDWVGINKHQESMSVYSVPFTLNLGPK